MYNFESVLFFYSRDIIHVDNTRDEARQIEELRKADQQEKMLTLRDKNDQLILTQILGQRQQQKPQRPFHNRQGYHIELQNGRRGATRVGGISSSREGEGAGGPNEFLGSFVSREDIGPQAQLY